MRIHPRRPVVLIPLVLTLLYAVYLAAGHWLVPALIRAQATDFVATRLAHKALALGEIGFNPFTMEAEIRDLAVTDTRSPAPPLVAVRRLLVNVSAGSIFRLSPSLDLLTIEEPRIDAILRRDGTLNLLELVPPDDGEPPAAIRIGVLSVSGGRAAFTDQRAAAPLRKELHTIGFVLRDFATTSAEGGGFKLDAHDAGGERFEWSGTLSMAPLASEGRYRIDALRLATVSRFLGDLLPATVDAGVLSLAGDYRFAATPAAQGAPARTVFDANLSSLTVTGLRGATKAGDGFALGKVALGPTRFSHGDGRLSLGALELTGISASLAGGEAGRIEHVALAPTQYALSGKVAEIGAVKAGGIAVTGRGAKAATLELGALTVAPSTLDLANASARAGAIDLSGLKLPVSLGKDNAASIPGLYPLALPAAKQPGSPPAEAVALRWGLAGLTVSGATLRVTRDGEGDARIIDIAAADLGIGALDDSLGQPVPVTFRATIDGKASVSAAGQVEPHGGGATLAVMAEGLPLADLAALGPPVPGIDVKAGTLGGKGDLKITLGKKAPGIRFAGDAKIAGLRVTERQGGGDLLSWVRLDATGIDYRGESVRIRKVTLDRPVSQVTITADARLNLAALAGAPPEEQPAGAAPAPQPVPVKPANTAAPLAIRIGKVEFIDGTIGFADQSIEPNFSVSIKGFAGSISGLSTTPGSQASFDLKGYVVDRFAPVTISGRANPFAYDADTDITASFKGIELPVFNPYSGTYAGYAIAKGKLSTDLRYRIVDRRLEASHHVVLDQLEWGEATPSKKQVSLPVRLASSLLKDRHGVITLDLPVAGAVDDPQFRIWPVVWQVVGNVMTRIVTAPFTMIGNMFKGADKAQFIAFDAGSDALPADAAANLAALAKGLAERPEVKLDVPAGAGVREDAEAMTTARLQAAALAAGKNPPVDYAALDDEDKADRLRKVYKEAFGKGPEFPEEMPSGGIFAGKQASQAAAAAQTAWLETALRPKFEPTDADLATLGQARAEAIRHALLAEGALDAGRVFVTTAAGPVARDGRMVMELKPK